MHYQDVGWKSHAYCLEEEWKSRTSFFGALGAMKAQ